MAPRSSTSALPSHSGCPPPHPVTASASSAITTYATSRPSQPSTIPIPFPPPGTSQIGSRTTRDTQTTRVPCVLVRMNAMFRMPRGHCPSHTRAAPQVKSRTTARTPEQHQAGFALHIVFRSCPQRTSPEHYSNPVTQQAIHLSICRVKAPLRDSNRCEHDKKGRGVVMTRGCGWHLGDEGLVERACHLKHCIHLGYSCHVPRLEGL